MDAWDYDAALLRRLARESKEPDQVRRLMTLALIYDGARRTQAAEAGGVTLQVVRDWGCASTRMVRKV